MNEGDKMKDKENQNCDNCVHNGICFERARIEEIDGKESEAMKSWEEYVKQYGCQYYQPKIPENSVILSKEEYEKYKIIEYLGKESKSTTIPAHKLFKTFKEIEEKASQETAERIIAKIKQFLSYVETVVDYDKYSLYPEIGYKCSEVDDFLDKLEKECGAEIKE